MILNVLQPTIQKQQGENTLYYGCCMFA